MSPLGHPITACCLLQKDEFLRLVINSVRNDLISRNEAFQCLGLDFIANGGPACMAPTNHASWAGLHQQGLPPGWLAWRGIATDWLHLLRRVGHGGVSVAAHRPLPWQARPVSPAAMLPTPPALPALPAALSAASDMQPRLLPALPCHCCSGRLRVLAAAHRGCDECAGQRCDAAGGAQEGSAVPAAPHPQGAAGCGDHAGGGVGGQAGHHAGGPRPGGAAGSDHAAAGRGVTQL